MHTEQPSKKDNSQCPTNIQVLHPEVSSVENTKVSSVERYQGVLCGEVPRCPLWRGTKVFSVERYQGVLCGEVPRCPLWRGEVVTM